MFRSFAAAILLTIFAMPVHAGDLIEPHIHFESNSSSAPSVAVTLDACSGKVDWRILDVLVQNQIKATIFITGRWLKTNSEALKTLTAHPELFQLEDHGLNHIPAVIGDEHPYGLLPAGTLEGVMAEVQGGAKALLDATGDTAHWYRGATALYSPKAITAIQLAGYRIAGFSLNADFGASASTTLAEKRMNLAKGGDVIIAHVNQPDRPAGAGIAQGLIDLKKRGFIFLKLDEALPAHG